MTPEEIAWVAGIIEGEGYIRYVSSSYRIQVAMTDEDVIRKLHQITSLGSVDGPYQYDTTRKPSWRWRISDKKSAVSILRDIRPWLGSRRGQEADQLLEMASKAPRPGRGVSRQGNRWVAYGPTKEVKGRRKQQYLGMFQTETEALKARSEYDKWLVKFNQRKENIYGTD